MPLKVVVAVGPLLEREGLCAMLEKVDDIEIVPADDPAADVLVIDARDALTRVDPGRGVMVLGEEASPEVAEALLGSSAGRAYLLYDDVRSCEELAAAIREVAAGRTAIGRHAHGVTPIASLTSRQSAVLAEVATGKSNDAIAAALGITKRAVERHLGAIYAKLGLQNDEGVSARVAAALLYLRASRRR